MEKNTHAVFSWSSDNVSLCTNNFHIAYYGVVYTNVTTLYELGTMVGELQGGEGHGQGQAKAKAKATAKAKAKPRSEEVTRIYATWI